MTLSDSRPDQHQACCCGSLPHIRDGSPTLHKILSRHAILITPVDQIKCIYRFLPCLLRPSPNIGRVGVHILYFRGLLKVHSRYGLPVCSQPKSCTSVSRASGGRSPYPPVWIATGLNRQLPGRNFHPLAPYTLVAHPHLVVASKSSNGGSSTFYFTSMQREVFSPEMMQIFQVWKA